MYVCNLKGFTMRRCVLFQVLATLLAGHAFAQAPRQVGLDGPLLAAEAAEPRATPAMTNATARYITPHHLRYPYIATDYIKPLVREGERVEIGWRVTDWNHSLARFNDDSPRFDVELKYTTDGVSFRTLVKKGVKTGYGSFDLGALAPGVYQVGVKCIDLKSHLPSYTSWHEFRVEPASFFKVEPDEVYTVTDDDLAEYSITPDPGLERRVYIEMDDYSKFAPKYIRTPYAKISEMCRANIDEYLKKNPHKSGAVAGYTVYIPALDGKPTYRAFERSKVVYDPGYDAAEVERRAEATGRGLQKLFDDKAAAGFRRLVMKRGVYRISNKTPIVLPSKIEIDLNASTIKLNQFAGLMHGMVRLTVANVDTALVNGVIEGDYYAHDYAGTKGSSEGVHGLVLSGSRYCRLENLTIRDMPGYGGGTGVGTEGAYGDKLSYKLPAQSGWNVKALDKRVGFVKGGLDWRTGRLDDGESCRYTTAQVPVENWKPFGYLSVSKMLGYQGILTRNWNYTVCFYDKDGRFISGEVAMQYRNVFIPRDAATARFSIEVGSQEEADNCKLVVALWKIPWNCVMRNCTIDHCRCCGFAPGANRNFLFEGNLFVRSGEALVSCGIDCEDGWDQSHDTFFIRNTFSENPLNDFVSCSGHNMVLIGNRGKISFYARSFSPVVVSNECDSLTLGCANRNRTGYWRYEGNRFKKLFLGNERVPDGCDWFSILRDRAFTSEGLDKPMLVHGGANGVFLNCSFDGVDASPGTAIDCSFNNCSNKWARYTGGRWKNCRMVNSAMIKIDSTNTYEKCTFRNCALNFALSGLHTYDGCTFENVKTPVRLPEKIKGTLMPNCKIEGKCVFPAGWCIPAR